MKWEEGGLAYLAPQLVTVVTTLACLFVLLWTFGQRRQLARQARTRLYRQAWGLFAVGLAALVLYVVLHAAVKAGFYYRVLGWESDDLRWILGDVVLLVTYAAFFAMLTRAFVLLGLVEFLGIDA